MRKKQSHISTRKTTLKSRKEATAISEEVDARIKSKLTEIKKDVKSYRKIGDIERNLT